MSSPKQSKTGLGYLLAVGGSGGNSPRFVPPVLREVGKLAAGVASVSTTGSATGNPRNKCILKPGHSHIDWVRLSNSRDLTGLGERAGKLEVTLEELAKHNKISDGWLAINGKVFNVTSYFPFHPGGVDELKKGLGIDATKLFYEVHSWVNCDTLLKSCYVGRLLTSPLKETKEPKPPEGTDQPPGPQIETEDYFDPQSGPSTNGQTHNEPIDIIRPEEDRDSYPSSLEAKSLEIHSYRSTHEDPDMELTTSNFYSKYFQNTASVGSNRNMPKFEWIQKFNVICISFNMRRFSNPVVEARRLDESIQVVLCYDGKTVVNDVWFAHEVEWPCHLRAIEEDGKVELKFRKTKGELWSNYGILKQAIKTGYFPEDRRIDYVVRSKREVAANTFLVELQRNDGVVMSVPIGYHVRVFSGSGDGDISSSYTPIPKPETIFPKPANATWGGDTIYLMVKRYENGNVSKHICDAVEGTTLQVSRPISPGFKLVKVYDKSRFICLAAGTGLTPMLSVMLCMLQRRSRKCLRFTTLLCNNKKEDIPFLEEYKNMLIHDRNTQSRLSVKHILTEPGLPMEPNFLKGHITIDHIRNAIEQSYTPKRPLDYELFVIVCGPTSFNDICSQYLRELMVPEELIYVFQG